MGGAFAFSLHSSATPTIPDVATQTQLEPVSTEPQGSAPGEKGLKSGAISFVSNVVIGTASVAPAYSLAATLGFIVAVSAPRSTSC
jgi:hypothetical protein